MWYSVFKGQEYRYLIGEVITLGIERAIREYLISHGIKQTFISKQCEWTKQKTSAIMTGKKKITVEEYGYLCDAIGVPYDYFFNAVAGQDSA